MDRFPSRGNLLRVGTAVFGLGLAAVGCANYSGDGNEFVVTGRTTDIGKQSIQAEILEIGDVSGEADGWFEIGNKHRLHDNCDCHGAWNGRKKYGRVENAMGEEIELSDLEEGVCVEFHGKIRSNAEGKTHSDRPVYDLARVTPCG